MVNYQLDYTASQVDEVIDALFEPQHGNLCRY